MPISPALAIKGIANITGSGLLNIPRINESFDYYVHSDVPRPEFMNRICEKTMLDKYELFKTFNMGVGMVVATDQPEQVMLELNQLGERAFKLGEVKTGSGKVFLDGSEL